MEIDFCFPYHYNLVNRSFLHKLYLAEKSLSFVREEDGREEKGERGEII
jgi:hypothetical protein